MLPTPFYRKSAQEIKVIYSPSRRIIWRAQLSLLKVEEAYSTIQQFKICYFVALSGLRFSAYEFTGIGRQNLLLMPDISVCFIHLSLCVPESQESFYEHRKDPGIPFDIPMHKLWEA